MTTQKKPIASSAELEAEILKERNHLSTDRMDMSISEITSMYEKSEIFISPDFQRLFRWDIEKRTEFIESLLLGIPIPPIFVAENQDTVWELVDGLQRVSTILSFMGLLKDDKGELETVHNNWEMQEGSRLDKLKGFTYETLSQKLRLTIKRATCRVEILRSNSNFEMKFELFKRLNTGGEPLSDQEVRNAIYRGISADFNVFLSRLAANPTAKKLIQISENKRNKLYHEEQVLRFFTLLHHDQNKAIKVNLSEQMSNFMFKVVKQEIAFDYAAQEKLFNSLINEFYGIDINLFIGGGNFFSTSLYDGLMVGLGKNWHLYENMDSTERTRILKEKIDKLTADDTFKASYGSSDKTRVVARIKIATDVFANI